MAGSTITFAVLIIAAAVVASAIVVDQFPEMTSELLAKLTKSPEPGNHSQYQMGEKGTR